MNNPVPRLIAALVPAFLYLCLVWGAAAQPGLEPNASANGYPSQVAATNQLTPPSPQPVLGDTTSRGSGQPGSPLMGTSALAGSSANLSRDEITGPPLASWGPISIYPNMLYKLVYGNGVPAAPGSNTTTVINTIAPGIMLGVGDHWTLTYTPSLIYYSSSLFKNVLDESVLLHGTTTNGDWILGLAQSYVDTTQPLLETGGQTEQVFYATVLTGTWQMSTKLSLELAANQDFRFSTIYPGLHQWTTADWLNYQVEPQLGLALGPTIGYDELSVGSDMPFEQLKGRITFRPGTKLALSVDGGMEDRQFIHPSSPALLTPVFDASVFYQLFDSTSITLIGSRTVVPPLYSNEVSVITTANASIRHDLNKLFFVEVFSGYISRPLTQIQPGPLPDFFAGTPPTSAQVEVRNDTTEFVKVSATAKYRAHLTASVFYFYSDTHSSQEKFSLTSSQVGLELNYRY
jgi:hypothetical protein